ncbi:hypothetical protein EXY23_27635, partial [Roseicella aquatilis]
MRTRSERFRHVSFVRHARHLGRHDRSPQGHRRLTLTDKLRMVRESLEPGAVVQAVADRNGVSTGQLYTWRKE